MTPSRATNRWTAQWIWDSEPLGARERQVIAARTEVTIEKVPDAVPARIFADALYVLYVNGREISRGPGRANPRSRRFDAVDLAGAMQPGVNVITIVAAANARASRNWMPAPTALSQLAGGAVVFEADVAGRIVATGADWRTTTIEGWTLSPPTGIVSQRGLECLDLGALPADLFTSHTPHERWRPAAVKSGRGMGDRESDRPPSYPFGPTQPAEVSPAQARDRPLSSDAPRRVWLLPDIGHGTLDVDIEGDGGEQVSLATFDVLEADGSIRNFPEPIGVQLTAARGRARAETLDTFGLRGVVVDAPETVTVHRITLRERTFPLTGSARFRCDDPFLEQLFAAGRRTVTLCSLDAYLDNPTREGRAWTGDAVVHQMVDFATNSDWSLATWNPKLGALSATADGMIPPAVAGDGEHGQYGLVVDWPLHWIHSVWNVHRYRGSEAAAELLPGVERVLTWFEQFLHADTGLPTDVYGWALVDWAWVPTNGASSVLAGLLGRGYRELAEMAEHDGDRGRAERARRRHASLSRAFELFWDPGRERYADTLQLGRHGPTASVHAQAAAIVAGFCPASRLPGLVAKLADRQHHVHATLSVPEGDPGMDGSVLVPGAEMMLPALPDPWWNTDTDLVMAQPFFRYVVHDAFAAAGRADLILDSLRDWQHLLDRCDSTLGETFWGGTVAQGWSCTPVRDLITRIAGITPARPGFDAVAIAPALGHLTWLEAVAPTPAGEVTVRVENGVIDIDSPLPIHISGRRFARGCHRLPLRSA